MTQPFLSPEPQVKLVKRFADAYRNFLATARTCYSSKGLIEEDSIDDKWDFLAKSLYKAGHHTTLQHSHFQFTLDNVSRHFIWSFLHSHPFYNSEQVSQRYVTVKPGNAAVPPLQGEALTVYRETIEYQMSAYEALVERLKPLARSEYAKRFPKRPIDEKKYRLDIKRKAQEIARYALPVATFAYMYHTISGVTLLRYNRLCKLYDAPHEQTVVVQKMVQQLLEAEPKFADLIEAPLEEDGSPEWKFFEQHNPNALHAKSFIDEFDAELEGRVSKLTGYKTDNERILADSVRETLGVPRAQISDQDAIRLALDPGENRLLGESLNLTTLSKLSRCLFHPSYTFKKKISHTADSQDQRHRMTPASRPILAGHQIDAPDFITPELIKQDESVEREYAEIMARSWEAMAKLRKLGVKEEYVQYLLPNAVSVRFSESSDLLNLHHKLAMRLCYNAQEEIWRASVDEAQQIREINPTIGTYLLPPCTLRVLSKTKPICPEGDRFCGEKVWNYDIDDYQRVI